MSTVKYPELQSLDYVDLCFIDNAIIKIPKTFYDKYDSLKVKLINYSSDKFKKYVMPIIYGESMKGLSFDTREELDELIDILHAFHISDLTDEQFLNLGEASSLIKKAFRIKNYILSNSKVKEDGTIKLKDKNVRDRITNFATDWYVLILALQKSSQKYSNSFLSLNYDYIINLIMSNQYKSLCVLNISQWGIISIFVDYFVSFIIESKDKITCLINLSLSFCIENPSISLLSNEQSILEQLKSLLNNQSSLNPSATSLLSSLTPNVNTSQPTISSSIIPALSKVLTTANDLFKF